MDIPYAVRQLDLEIKQDEDRSAVKKETRKKLYGVLSDQEKALVDKAKQELNAPPKPSGGPPGKT